MVDASSRESEEHVVALGNRSVVERLSNTPGADPDGNVCVVRKGTMTRDVVA